MNIYAVPMLIAGILCALISFVTWMFRRRENINRVFSFFTLMLAIDSLGFYLWFQFGSMDHIETWMRVTFPLGFLVPIGLVFFFFAFTGYDRKMEDKVLKIKVRHFRMATIIVIIAYMVLELLTDLVVKIPDDPQHIWDTEFGPVGYSLFPLFAVIFSYLFVMAFKSYKAAGSGPEKRFILLLSVGTIVWMVSGYGGAILFSPTGAASTFINYIGTAMMATFFFVAIVKFQSDKLRELNLNLERKVVDRTQELNRKNLELEDTLSQLRQMQKQIIVQEKMATLGQLVAGLTHEINTPIGAMRSMNDTKSKAVRKLQAIIADIAPDNAEQERQMKKAMEIIFRADNLIDEGTDRLNEIIENLKQFARLDEAETVEADIHEGIDRVLALIEHDMLENIEVVREFGDVPPFVCQAGKLNQVFLNILKNASQAIEGNGRIKISTKLAGEMVHVSIEDTGKGIEPGELDTIFDPGFTTKGSVVRARLGLSICSQIVQEHGGRIELKSSPGEGSVFTVIIPMRSS